MHITDDQFNTNGIHCDDKVGNREHDWCGGDGNNWGIDQCAECNDILCPETILCGELLQEQHDDVFCVYQFDDRWVL